MRKPLIFFVILILSGCLLNFLPNVYATTIFSDGFESGNFNAWTGTSGTPTVVEDPIHHGSYAMEATGTSTIDAYKTITGQKLVYIRVYARWTALHATQWTTSIRIQGGASFIAKVNIYSGKVELYWGYPSLSSTSAAYTFNVDTWYCIELKVFIDSSGEYRVYINGDSVVSTATDTSGAPDANTIRVGLTSGSQVSTTVNFDCVVVADAYIGPEEEGQQINVQLQETLVVTDSLNTQKNLYRSGTETLIIEESYISRKDLYRSTSETSSVTSIIETQKTITVSMIVDLSAEIIISGVLETIKHMAVTLIELLETANLNAVLNVILPIIPLTMDDLVGLIIVFFVIGLACSVAFVVAYRRR